MAMAFCMDTNASFGEYRQPDQRIMPGATSPALEAIPPERLLVAFLNLSAWLA